MRMEHSYLAAVFDLPVPSGYGRARDKENRLAFAPGCRLACGHELSISPRCRTCTTTAESLRMGPWCLGRGSSPEPEQRRPLAVLSECICANHRPLVGELQAP
ncbi:MAG: hypothetical protein QOJ42_6429 [Acidobacteriaceae bacterium]|nr:hypothetical protein [Acidobacteriaceae bacterium]